MRHYIVAVAVGLMGAIATAGVISSALNALASVAPVELPAALQLAALSMVGLLLGLALRDFARVGIALGITVVLSAVIIGVILAVPGLDPTYYTVARFNYALTQSVFALFLAGAFVTIGAVLAVIVNVYVRNIDIDAVGVSDGPATPGWNRRSVRDQAGERS